MQDGTKRFAVVREARNCCSSIEAIEGARDNDRDSFNIRSVSSLTRMLVVGWINYLLLDN